jgi:FkbM family methyltransferase
MKNLTTKYPFPEDCKMNKKNYLIFPDQGKIYFHTIEEARFIYDEIFIKKEYLRHGITLKHGDTVFDAGANIGMFSLFASRECGNDISMYAFEPIPETFSILKKNIDALDHRGRIKLFNMGLTRLDGPREAVFTCYTAMSGNSTMNRAEKEKMYHDTDPDDVLHLLKETNPAVYFLLMILYPARRWLIRNKIEKSLAAREVKCPLTSLSSVMREFSVTTIDLLKIDTEGAELDILRGIADGDWPKIRQIVMEVHDIDGRLAAVSDLLKKKGFAHVVAEQPHWCEVIKSPTYNLYARR